MSDPKKQMGDDQALKADTFEIEHHNLGEELAYLAEGNAQNAAIDLQSVLGTQILGKEKQ